MSESELPVGSIIQVGRQSRIRASDGQWVLHRPTTFEVCWKMYGTAEVKAASMEEAASIAAKELINWGGETLNLEDLSVDGADVEP